MLHTQRLYSALLSNNCAHFVKYKRIPPVNLGLLRIRTISSSKHSEVPEGVDSIRYPCSEPANSQHIHLKHTIDSGSSRQSQFPSQDGRCVPRKRAQSPDVDDCLINAEITGLGSPISAMCWHKGPYSNYFGDGSEHTPGDAESGKEVHRDKALFPKADMVGEMEHLLSVERKERDRLRSNLERSRPLKIDEQISDKQLASRVSTLKLLSISSKIAKRPPSSAKPQLEVAKYLKEKRYQRMLESKEESFKADDQRKSTRKESTIETIRILDVDRLPLPILHHMVCYTLVKNVPAEKVLRLISNIASLRDKNKHICYQNLFRLAISNSSPVCAAEVVATLTRCYQSISIPFMVDYVRKYGTFSRKFLSNLISRYSNPQPLDIFRYSSHSRSLPPILTRPWSLLSFVNLLKNSSAKRYMYLNLLNYGYVPNVQKFDRIHAYGTMDYGLSGEILSFEKLLDDAPLISDTGQDPNRPKIYDKILELQYSGERNLDDLDLPAESHEPTPTSIQFIKVVGDQGQVNTGDTGPQFKDPGLGFEGENADYQSGFKDLDENLPSDGSHISWSLPWGLKRDAFHYRGKTYKLDRVKGWISVKSNVRINYLKNVKMNKRKRARRLLRRRAEKQAKLRVLNNL